MELEDVIGPVGLFVTHYGLFGVRTRDEVQACRFLNLVFGALHLNGVPSFAVRPDELGTFKLDSETRSFMATGIPGTYRSVGNKDTALNRFQQPKPVTIDQARSACRLAEKFDTDLRLPRYLPLLLDSYGRLASREWDYTFYSAWMIIETKIVLDWDEVAKSEIISQDEYNVLRAAKIADPGVKDLPKDVHKISDLSVKHKLTALTLVGRLPKVNYVRYDRLRERRNEILHPDIPATEADAKDCYEAAEAIVRARVSELQQGSPPKTR
ncbi:MAG TPA: hypothetical protein VGR56_04150 [Nitrososphaerales archaeon]|nr:hypothetical protein [Nitrososphaerales archaeon]